MSSTSSKSSKPDPMEEYLGTIANVAGRDYSPSTKGLEAAGRDISESLLNTGDCFRETYRNIATTELSKSGFLRRIIDAVTTVDKGLQQLIGLEYGNDAAAQPILESMEEALKALERLYPAVLDWVKPCLDSGLKTKPEWREKLR